MQEKVYEIPEDVKRSPTQKLEFLADALGIHNISKFVLENPKFPIWSGSSKPHQHHYGKGGLAQHTFEVVDLCLRNNEYFANIVDNRKLFLAALFHDAGKMWDYQPICVAQGPFESNEAYEARQYSEWDGTTHKRHIHHITRSALVWHEAVLKRGHELPFNDDDILHAILAHHQRREWGSPVSPNTRLAWLLHLCDGISARMDDAERWDHTTKD